METNQNQTKIDINNIPVHQVGGGGVDMAQYEGQRVKIGRVEPVEVTTNYDEEGTFKEGLQRKIMALKVSSSPLTEITRQDGSKIEIRASELFNLKQKDGQWGISASEKAKIQKFMKRQKVQKPSDLVGTLATVRTYENKEGNTYLGFVV